MFRGAEVPQQMIDHPSFEYHKCRKLDTTKDEDRKLIDEYWTSKEGDKVEGLTLHMAKYHK